MLQRILRTALTLMVGGVVIASMALGLAQAPLSTSVAHGPAVGDGILPQPTIQLARGPLVDPNGGCARRA